MTEAFSLVGGVLQLTVPSYGLRLIRRFGVERTGWFIVAAFASLALLHVIGGFGPMTRGGVPPEIIYGIASVLLLIGLGHVETLVLEREHASQDRGQFRNQCERQFKDKISELAQLNKALETELKASEAKQRALEESAAHYRGLFKENPHAMCLFDIRSCRVLAGNQAALNLYGYTEEEFARLTAKDLIPPDDHANEFLRRINHPFVRPDFAGVWQHRKKDGTLMKVEVAAIDIKQEQSYARLVLMEDIGPRQRREREKIQGTKFEIVGNVAGGIAHHFNNILAIIQGHVSLLQEKPTDAASVDSLKRISEAIGRATGLTDELLAAGGRLPMKPEPVDLSQAIQRWLPPIKHLVGHRIFVQHSCSARQPLVLADPRLLEQALLDIVLNARDAMPKGGTLTINTAPITISRDTDSPLQVVRLIVRDTGSGMTEEVRNRLFEPFFTTKDVGKGTGLALASAHGAIRQMSGWMEVSSEAGEGAEFRIFLPCVSDAAGNQTAAAKQTIAGTVLLVVSDDRVRNLARCVLNWNQYRVIEADCRSTASVLWQDCGSKADLLLTDEKLTDGDGSELAAEFRQAKPNLKVIYLSESNEDTLEKNGLVLPQSFTSARLLEAVRNCLGCGTSTEGIIEKCAASQPAGIA